MVFSKSVSYTLDQLRLKKRYIPTSGGAAYKSQAWIEACDSRTAKVGEPVYAVFHTLSGWVLPFFLTISSGFSLVLLVIWARVAASVAAPFNNKAIEEDTMVC